MTAIERGGGAATLTTENSQTEAFVKMLSLALLTIVFHGKWSENKV